MAWHTDYRPKKVADLHITSVRSALQKMMQSARLPHVFLFAGPKGTGKTSTARIIGAVLNDPANQKVVQQMYFDADESQNGKSSAKRLQLNDVSDTETQHDIYSGNSFIVNEMDAASNRGIDDIRQLKELVQLPPQQSLVSLYILDEVHMLTTEAFNALLKLLEEPPPHAVFVLATTELHKIPATVVSRCTLFQFQKASQTEISAALEQVCVAESLTADPEVISQIAQVADGSFRDAIKYLETAASQIEKGANISVESLDAVLNTSFTVRVPELVELVISKQEDKVCDLIAEFRSQGLNTKAVLSALVDYLHAEMVASVTEDEKSTIPTKVSLFLLQEIDAIDIQKTEAMPLLSLELTLLNLIFRAKDRSSQKNTGSSGGTGTNNRSSVHKKAISVEEELPEPIVVAASDVNPDATKSKESDFHQELEITDTELSDFSGDDFKSDNLQRADHVDTRPLLEAWQQFVQLVESRNSTVAALLRSAKPLVEQSNGVAKIEVYYSFHRDQLMQPKFQDMLKTSASEILGGTPTFEFILAREKREALMTETPTSDTRPQSSQSNDAVTPLSSEEDLVALAGQALL